MKKILCMLACAAMTIGAAAQDQSDISPLQLGLQGGVGYMTTTGSLNDDFGGAVNFTAGLTADYKRLRLKADFAFGQPKFNNPNLYGIKDPESGRDLQITGNSTASQVSLGVQLGYKVWQKGRLSITPAAGLFYTRYSFGLNDIKWEKDKEDKYYFLIQSSHDVSLGNTSWMASIDVDYRLGSRITKEPFFLNQRYSRLSTYVRVTPWVAGGNYKSVNPAVKGLYTGVTVRLTGFMQSLGF